MKYEALKTFHGVISMNKGEQKNFDPQYFIVKDLIRARLITEVKEKKRSAKRTKKKAEAEIVEVPETEETKGAE